MTATTLHITSGDTVGRNLAQAGLGGDILVWHDVLYDGARCPGWPDADAITARVEFLFRVTDGAQSREKLQRTMRDQYERLAAASAY